MNKIIQLIGKVNKSEELIKQLDKHSENNDINEIKLDGKNIAHMAIINKNIKLFDWLLDNHPISFIKGDNDGNTPTHMLTEFGLFDLCDKLLEKNRIAFNYVNDKKRSPLIKLIYSPEYLKKIVVKYPDLDYFSIDYKNMTLAHYIVLECKRKNDVYYDILKILLPKMKLSEPVYNPIFHMIISLSIDHLFDLMLETHKDNLEILDANNACVLDLAFRHSKIELMKKLIEKGVNKKTNKSRYFYRMAIDRQSKLFLELLIDNEFDVDEQDDYLMSGLFYMTSEYINHKKVVTAESLYKAIAIGNLNLSDAYGATPLSLLGSTGEWKYFKEILKKKKLDIFKKNGDDVMALTLIKFEDRNEYFEMVVDSYINQLEISKSDKNKLIYASDYKCTTNEISKHECRQLIKQQMSDNFISYPTTEANEAIDFFLVQGTFNINYGIFEPILSNILTTYIIMLNKYENIIYPYMHYDDIRQYNDILNIGYQNMLFSSNNYLHNISGIIDYISELSPFSICYGGKGLYHQHKELDIALLKLATYKVRFVVMDVLIQGKDSGHANIIIFDGFRCTLERFEPNGNVASVLYDFDNLDNEIKTKLIPLFESAYEMEIEYIGPKDYDMDIGFQAISNDGDIYMQKTGDPIGYCFLWCMWYLELRLENELLHPASIVQIAKDKIIKKYRKEQISEKSFKDTDIVFSNFIRDYSHKLDRQIEEFYIKNNLNNEDRRFKIPRNRDKLINVLVNNFYDIMANKK